MGKFTNDVTVTAVNNIVCFVLGLAVSIIIARTLGPEKQGVYFLCILLASLIDSFLNLGLDATTIYQISKKNHPLKEILNNNLILTTIISGLGILAGIIIIIFFHNLFFKGIPYFYLFLALLFIPASLILKYLRAIFLGLQKIQGYNLTCLAENIFSIGFLLIIIILSPGNVLSMIIVRLIGAYLIILLIARYLKKKIKRFFYQYKIKRNYIKEVSSYGIKIYLGNVFGFLNYRANTFLVSAFLNPLAVGFYSVAVGMAEKLWLIASSAGTVLFPRVSATKDKKSLKELTPIVSRNILFLTAIGGLVLYFLSHWLIVFFLSEAYLNSIRPLEILIPGVIVLSAAKMFGNDFAGRGKPILNVLIGGGTFCLNVILSILLIPRFNINGAALAATITYGVSFLSALIIYSKISGNSIIKSIFIQKSDLVLYRNLLKILKNKIVSFRIK